METQFEIHSHLEKKHYVEYYRHILRKRMIWVIIYIVAGLLGMLLSMALNKTSWVIYGCVMLLYAVWLYFRPWMVAGKHLKDEIQFDGTESVESVTRFGDELQDETKSQSVRVSYDKIETIHIAKYVIILTDTRKMAFILDKTVLPKEPLRIFFPLSRKNAHS